MNSISLVWVLAVVADLIGQSIAGVLDNMIDVKQNHAIKEVRILYQLPHKENIPTVYSVLRGEPIFAEVDFLPRYIPQGTSYVSVSVIIPRTECFGRQYVLGFHRERWQMPACRLCTNTDQRYTLPLVLYLGFNDNMCFTGRINTYWKVEAIPFNRPLDDRTDLTIGLVYDKDRQLRICNTDATPECRNARNIFFAARSAPNYPQINAYKKKRSVTENTFQNQTLSHA